MGVEGWKEVRLDSVCSMKYGKMPNKNDLVEEGYPVFSGYRIVGYHKDYLYEKPEVVVVARGVGGTGDVKLSPPKSFITNLSIVLSKLNEREVFKEFLFYYLSNRDLKQLNSGSAQSQITINHLAAYKVELPPLQEQKQIAAILSALDEKIELNHRINQNFEAMAQALFQSWFVDFEPFRDGEFVESELGLIPKGWRVVNLLEIANLLSGGTPKTSVDEYWNGSISWVAAKDVTANQGKFILNTERTVTELGIEKSSAKLLPKNTMVITARGTVGAYCLLGEEMAINQSTYGLKAQKSIGDFFVFLSVSRMVDQFKQHSYGTVFDTITTKTFKHMNLVLPNSAILYDFNKLVQPIYDKIFQNQKQTQTLTQLRDTLLPKLMSGEIRVPIEEKEASHERSDGNQTG